MSSTPSFAEVVLRLLDGRSERRELVFEAGRGSPALTVGSKAGWKVCAAHVAPAHVMFAFDGRRLFVSTLHDEMALLDGVPLDARWTEVPARSELRFGSARISIARRARSDEPTAIIDDDDDVTCIADGASVQAHGSDDLTCFDDARLAAALRRSASDEDDDGEAHDGPPTRPSPPPSFMEPAKPRPRLVRKALASSPSRSRRPEAPPESQPPPSPSEVLTAELLAGLELAGAARSAARASLARSPLAASAVSSRRAALAPAADTRATAPSRNSPRAGMATRPSPPLLVASAPPERAAASDAPHTPPPHPLVPLAMSCETPSMAMSVVTIRTPRRNVVGTAPRWRWSSVPQKALVLLVIPVLVGVFFAMRAGAMMVRETAHILRAPLGSGPPN